MVLMDQNYWRRLLLYITKRYSMHICYTRRLGQVFFSGKCKVRFFVEILHANLALTAVFSSMFKKTLSYYNNFSSQVQREISSIGVFMSFVFIAETILVTMFFFSITLLNIYQLCIPNPSSENLLQNPRRHHYVVERICSGEVFETTLLLTLIEAQSSNPDTFTAHYLYTSNGCHQVNTSSYTITKIWPYSLAAGRL